MSGPPIKRKRVAIFPASRCDSASHLLASLAELYPADFVRGFDTDAEHMDAAIFFPEAWDLSDRVFERGVCSFRFARFDRSTLLDGNESVTFSDHTALHVAFRNAQVPVGTETSVAEGITANGDVTLARRGSASVWQFRKDGRVELHTSAAAVPQLRPDRLLWSYLRPMNWLDLFPLLHFLRRVTADADWVPPPARACFMFDDPNLHSVRYGYLDYGELVRDARVHNYHVAFAMVALDAAYAAPKACELVRANQERLSLLIHGNNHLKFELARKYTPEEALRLLAQALQRVDRFECRTKVRVAKVMVPPHRRGCSELLMEQMLRLPFEGVCTSANSLLESRRPLPPAFGLSPTWLMAGGVPVVGRSHLGNGLTPLRLASFLGQPIITYGHHQDCAEGIERLARVADTVNSWCCTTWTDMKSILRDQYRTMRNGELLHVEMRSRRVRVPIPEGVSWVIVHSPSGVDRELVKLGIRSNSDIAASHDWGVPIAVGQLAVLEFSMFPGPLIDPSKVRRPSYRPWAPIRRALVIARDRLAPVTGRLPSGS